MRPYVLAADARLCEVRDEPTQDTLDGDPRRGRESVMRIVDAQIHLWGSGLPSNMAHRQVTSFTTEEAVGLMDEGGVDAAVIHPPGWDPNSTEMAFKAVRDFPGRFAILGAFPLSPPDKRALVETWRSQPGMLGLRYGFLQEPMRGWLADGTLDWLWAAAERAGVPIAMLATDSLPHIGRIAEHHPGLRLTIDHLGGRGGNTPLKDDAAMEHMPALIKLARHSGAASQHCRQGNRRTRLLQRTVSVHQHAHVLAPDLRRLRAGAHVLGDRHHEDAVLLAAVRDDVHRGATLVARA